MLSLAVTATSVPTRPRTASATARASRARFSSDAAPAVVAPVQLGAEERAQQVAVAEVQLEDVEAGVDGEARGGGEVADDPREVVLGRGPREPHRLRREHPGRGEPGLATDRCGDGPGVAELHGRLGARCAAPPR